MYQSCLATDLYAISISKVDLTRSGDWVWKSKDNMIPQRNSRTTMFQTAGKPIWTQKNMVSYVVLGTGSVLIVE